MFFPVRGLTRSVCVIGLLLASAAPAWAQFQSTGAAIGERYHIEASAMFWSASPDLLISSESLGIPGDDVDLVTDLGIEEKRLRELRIVARPATKHKFRFHYLPIKYEARAVLVREFVFNGQLYRPGLLVATDADLTTIRFGYEYDFFYASRGYAGVFVDLKYTNVDVTMNSPIGEEFVRSVAPIPGIGFAGRGYVSSNVSITGEVSFFKIPEGLGGEDFGGRYIDFDLYGTVNFNDYVGAQLGYKTIDVNYFEDVDAGSLGFKGLYFGGVVRF